MKMAIFERNWPFARFRVVQSKQAVFSPHGSQSMIIRGLGDLKRKPLHLGKWWFADPSVSLFLRQACF
jgi:hypothetical protein